MWHSLTALGDGLYAYVVHHMPKLSQTLFVPGSIQATQRKFVAVWVLPLTNINLDPRAEGISSLVASHQLSQAELSSTPSVSSSPAVDISRILRGCVNAEVQIISKCPTEMKRDPGWQLTTPQARCGAIGLSHGQLRGTAVGTLLL